MKLSPIQEKCHFMRRIIRSEMTGYEDDNSRWGDSCEKLKLKFKIIVFTTLFGCMCVENFFRALDTPLDWSTGAIEKLEGESIGAVIQPIACLVLMVLNNILWLCKKDMTKRRNVIHSIVASILVLLLVPIFVDTMLPTKFALTLVNIYVFQLAFSTSTSLTPLHQFLTLSITTIYIIIRAKTFYKIDATQLV